jgi:hypothetical protein
VSAPVAETSDPLSRIIRMRLGYEGLVAVRRQFAALYVSSFPKEERRRIGAAGPTSQEDDGMLPGPTIADLVASGACRFEAYFDDAALVAVMISLDLGRYSLGDYLACNLDRGDLSGLGGRALRDWLADAAARDQDAVAEVSPLEVPPEWTAAGLGSRDGGPRAAMAMTRRRRRLFFVRNGFHLLDDVGYALPNGVAMSLAIRPRPSRAAPTFASWEIAAMAVAVAATYSFDACGPESLSSFGATPPG